MSRESIISVCLRSKEGPDLHLVGSKVESVQTFPGGNVLVTMVSGNTHEVSALEGETGPEALARWREALGQALGVGL